MLIRTGLRFVTAALVALLVPSIAFAQPAPRDLSKQADEAWDHLKAYTVEKKQEAVDTGRKLVRAADQDIKDLQKAAAKAGNEARAELRKEIKGLKAQRAVASKKLNEMGKATESRWEGAKQGFVDAYRDLHQSIEKAAAKLKA